MPALLAAGALLAGCGGDGAADAPSLVQSQALIVSLVPAGGAPADFHRELIGDLASRLELKPVIRPRSAQEADIALQDVESDATAPAAIAAASDTRLDFTAPYYQDPGSGALYGLAVAAGPDLQQKNALLVDLDEALSEMKDDGTLQKIYDKWFPGTDVPDPVLNDATG